MSNNSLFSKLQRQLQEFESNRNSSVENQLKSLYMAGINNAFISSGWGAKDQQIANNFSKLDRYGTRFCMDNYIKSGYTFITRPELNLSPMNIRGDRILNMLNTRDPYGLQFAIKALLDTRFSRSVGLGQVLSCPFIDYRNPFMTLLTNNLVGFSGSPSYQLEVFTDEPGYYGESQSFPIGSDSYRKPFDLNLEFVDPIGGPIEATHKFWLRYMELVTRGVVGLYPDQIAGRVMGFTVSIYRFLMDPSFRYVRKWFKYTGCFPVNRPGASVADYQKSSSFVDNLRKFSITYRCGSGVVDEDDPMVVKEFNDLAERYFPPLKCLRPGSQGSSETAVTAGLVADDAIDSTLEGNGLKRNPLLPEFNYTGVPYLLDTERGLRLEIISEYRASEKITHELNSDHYVLNGLNVQGYISPDIAGLSENSTWVEDPYIDQQYPAMEAIGKVVEEEAKNFETQRNKIIDDYVAGHTGMSLDQVMTSDIKAV